MTTEPQKVTASELKEDDRVRVTFEGCVDGAGDVRLPDGDYLFEHKLRTAFSIERLPPAATPLQVGEVVTWRGVADDIKVLGIDGGYAWIKGNWYGREKESRSEISIRELYRPSGIPISIESEE